MTKARCERCARSFAGIEEFNQGREKMLSRVFAAERGKRRSDLAGGAVQGGNENQQQERLRDRFERVPRARANQLD